MTQVADRVALPIRVHDTLLALAGRLDDDALTEARALLASAEVDRTIELVAGCLTAGAIPVSIKERNTLNELGAAANCDPELMDGLAIGGGGVRHRFTDGRAAGQPADAGVADALKPVLDVLPDIASVWSVWRTTPAGASPGPVPQRVVLIEVGTGGVAPATAYRVEHALRRAGLPATVEVLRDGVSRESYHADALLHAVQPELDLDSGGSVTAFPQPNTPEAPSWRSDAEPSAAVQDVELAEPESAEPFSYLPQDPDQQQPEPAPQEPPYQPPAWQSAQPVEQPVQDDSALNDQERDLLRQLHEELAKREQTGGEPTPPRGTPWPSAQHTGPQRTFEWPGAPRQGGPQVNGVPPAPGEHPPFPGN